jgi:hypothetical protein
MIGVKTVVTKAAMSGLTFRRSPVVCAPTPKEPA